VFTGGRAACAYVARAGQEEQGGHDSDDGAARDGEVPTEPAPSPDTHAQADPELGARVTETPHFTHGSKPGSIGRNLLSYGRLRP
jgi:hypothetical protein